MLPFLKSFIQRRLKVKSKDCINEGGIKMISNRQKSDETQHPQCKLNSAPRNQHKANKGTQKKYALLSSQ